VSGRVPSWLAEWLGLPTVPGADGAVWRLESDWSWPPWATLLLIAGAVLFIAVIYARESSGAGRAYRGLLAALRLAAVAIVLIMIAQWVLAVRVTGPPTIAVVIDRSASMGIADRDAAAELPADLRERLAANSSSEPTRLNLAKLLLAGDEGRLLDELAARYRLQLYFVDLAIERVPDSEDPAAALSAVDNVSADGPGNRSTRLGDAVRRILEDQAGLQPAAIILLSDGVVTEGVPLAEAARQARNNNVPLIAVGLGSPHPPRDIELAEVLVDEIVFVDDPVNVLVRIKASGLEGQPATIRLRRDGDPTPLAEKTITLPSAGQMLTQRLSHRPTKAGRLAYVVEIHPRDDETDQQNNRQRRLVEVRDEKIRVLVAHAQPSYEFRFVKNLLERDSTIELSTYLQDADPDYAEQDKTALRSFPVSRDELFEYDVLVLGDVDPRLLPRSLWESVRAFVVENGGGIVFAAGPRCLPWLYRDLEAVSGLFPMDLKELDATASRSPEEAARGFTVRPTPLGLQNAAIQLGDTPAETENIWRHLPPLYWLFPIEDLKPGAQVLAQSAFSTSHPSWPVICFQYVGAGRVLFHAIDSTWRWRLGAGDAYFARYWVQAVRFLARGKLARGRGAQLTADRRQYGRGEAVELRLRFLDPRVAPAGHDVSVVIGAANQPRRRVALRRNPAVETVFQASLEDLPVGDYEALLAEPQLPGNPPATQFSVVAPPGEFARPQMDAATLSAAAETTRGKFYTLADANRLLEELPAGRRMLLEDLPPTDLWNRWWMLAAFLGVITTEWILRKRKGML
jgi:hypothetical protein